MVRLCTLHVPRKHHNIFLAPRLTTIQRAQLDCTGREARGPSMNLLPRPAGGAEPATVTQQQLSVHSAARPALVVGPRASSCTRPSGGLAIPKERRPRGTNIEPHVAGRDSFGTWGAPSRQIRRVPASLSTI